MPAECVIGVDLGGTKAVAGAVDVDLAVRHRARREVPASDLPALLETLTELVDEVRDAVGGAVDGVGFGVPCLIDHERALAASSVHLPIAGVAFAEVMAERLGVPSFVDNDGNLALLAEHQSGAAAGERCAVMLTLGTGIAGAIVIGGELYRGSQGAAGEIGHMVVWADGPDCGQGCPSRGCLESLVSGTALRRDALELARHSPETRLGRALAAGRDVGGPLVTELAFDGDVESIALLTRLGEWLGIGLANVTNIFNPDVIVVGGGVMAAGELILGPARRVLCERALALPAEHVRVASSRFGADSGMLGAALLARDRLSQRVRA
ncbi:MAG: ROK family protein [Solirubrobacteraceae bacterium]